MGADLDVHPPDDLVIALTTVRSMVGARTAALRARGVIPKWRAGNGSNIPQCSDSFLDWYNHTDIRTDKIPIIHL
jgi:hypothetical protein